MFVLCGGRPASAGAAPQGRGPVPRHLDPTARCSCASRRRRTACWSSTGSCRWRGKSATEPMSFSGLSPMRPIGFPFQQPPRLPGGHLAERPVPPRPPTDHVRVMPKPRPLRARGVRQERAASSRRCTGREAVDAAERAQRDDRAASHFRRRDTPASGRRRLASRAVHAACIISASPLCSRRLIVPLRPTRC